MSIRIAIIESSTDAVNRIAHLLNCNADFDVAWTATTFELAMKKMAQDQPDLFLMGLALPDKATPDAIKDIKIHHAVPILALDTEIGGRHQKVFQCMGAGAIDVISIHPGMSETQALKVMTAKLVIMSKLVRASKGDFSLGQHHHKTKAAAPGQKKETLIAIGSSTGGPAALSAILSNIPANIEASFVLIQHLDKQFAKGFIQWLGNHSVLPIQVAHVGDKPKVGTVLVADQDDHLVLCADGRLGYTPDPIDNPYRPSVDAFYNSVAKHWGGHAVGILLTGMGKDGGVGLLAMRKQTFHTIAEDKSTCVVYGMPKAAVELNAAIEILPLHKIASAIIKCIHRF